MPTKDYLYRIRIIVVLVMKLLVLIIIVLCEFDFGLGLARIPVRRSNKPLNMCISEKTRKYFDRIISTEGTVGGAGGSSTLDGLIRLDKSWSNIKSGGWKNKSQTEIVSRKPQFETRVLSDLHFDVTVCGGTLGIFYALALQAKGYKTCIIERNKVEGRSQEWNISKKELNALIRMNILTAQELEDVISIEFNPVRVGFHTDTSISSTGSKSSNGFDLYVNDILNIGVKPVELIAKVKNNYESIGGVIFEDTSLSKVEIFDNTALISVNGKEGLEIQITSRLMIDAMGNASPIVRQIRGPVEPDGVCIVVGSCASGYNEANNTYSDVIYTDTPITTKGKGTGTGKGSSTVGSESGSQLQYFWEAFPAGSGKADRTTYLFTYLDAKPERPSVAEIFDDYWELLPRYQGVNVDDLKFLRILYGCFPTYRSSPLQTPFDRVLQVGDASGIQSPLSFGGFGSLTRHIERQVSALDDALTHDFLQCQHLALLNPYQPNLSACWMFQRAMSVPINKNPSADLIVNILKNSFSCMNTLGDAAVRPFLQDVLQFQPLLKTLFLSGIKDPITPLKIIPHVGLKAMADFVYHMFFMWWFTWLHENIAPRNFENMNSQTPLERFKTMRQIEQWKFGSGLDFSDHE